MSKELEILKKIKQDVIEFGDSGGYVRSGVKDFVDLQQALTPTPLDKLRESIIERLDIAYTGEHHFNENFNEFRCNDIPTSSVVSVDKLLKDKEYLLAKDICDYFIRSRRERKWIN